MTTGVAAVERVEVRPNTAPATVALASATAILGELAAVLLLAPMLAAMVRALSPGGGSFIRLAVSDVPLLGRTLAFAAVGATVAAAVGLAVALLLTGATRGWRACVAGVTLLPWVMPSSLLATGWIMAMGRDGAITAALREAWGVALPTVYGFVPAASVTGLRYLGVAVVVLLLATANRSGSAAVAGTLGVRGWRRAWWLGVVPLGPAVAAAWLGVFVFVIGDPIMPGMLLNATYGTQILVQANALMDLRGAAAMAAPVAMLGVIAALLAWKLLRIAMTDAGPLATKPRIVLPMLALLVALSPLAIAAAGHVVRAQSLGNVIAAARAADEEIARTLVLAAAGAGASALVGALVAARWTQVRREGGWTLAPLIVMNLVLPPAILALGVMELLARPGLSGWRGGDVGLVATYAARFAPLATLMLAAAWSSDDAGSARVAAEAMVRPVTRRWLWLDWPRRAAAILAVATVVLLPVVGELEASVLLTPPGVTTLGVRLYTMIHTSPDAAVSSLAVAVLLMVVGVALTIGGLGWLSARWRMREAA